MNKKELPRGIKAALIDMDGVLYDSMPYHAKAWFQMFSEIGINGDPDEFYLYEGMTGGATINMLFQRELGRPSTKDEEERLYARKAELFSGSGKKKMMPGAFSMVKTLSDSGLTTVLVTGSAQGSLLNSLDEDYAGFFPKEWRVTALDVSKGKPDPEPYLKGLEKAGVTKEEAIIIENAPLGVRAGKAAGCFTIAVTTGPIPREAFEKEGADMIFPDMPSFAAWLREKLKPSLGKMIKEEVERSQPDKVLIVTDKNVEKAVFPLLGDWEDIGKHALISIEPGEQNKSILTVEKVWKALEKCGATRRSLVVNIGGGMVTDLGGFSAATFKRGIRTINVPTTLLGAVDAATGGKTGINFEGLKNEIGTFHQPSAVIISSEPLKTLDRREIISGYAEMVKTALISDKELYSVLLDIEKVLQDANILEETMKKSVKIKEKIVESDPTEKGLRKILNFGHTAGHAFESLSHKRGKPLAHGEAVAHGMLMELILSHKLLGFPKEKIDEYAEKVLKLNYPANDVNESDIGELYELMAHDKKNRKYGVPDFTLLKEIGEPEIGIEPTENQIVDGLKEYIAIIN